jgi:hypothetical protein
MSRHEKTLKAIYATPTSANIRWADIESLFRSRNAKISQRAGSRVAVNLNGTARVFHRPHPQPEAKKATVESVREFLRQAGVKP